MLVSLLFIRRGDNGRKCMYTICQVLSTVWYNQRMQASMTCMKVCLGHLQPLGSTTMAVTNTITHKLMI